ncbi:unnamed protein product [Cyprideis torosa]|uniref:Gamma-aminobutyric acid receptor subunit beta n=1 Tax=Cyprideis torosa TaxID=163714 RepID=A0A7R8WE49_9CRUS|nr:unnamed protein product [Cyprideis torosa]CAG0889884.1 unnamed protein product [Cyprideis torosa]
MWLLFPVPTQPDAQRQAIAEEWSLDQLERLVVRGNSGRRGPPSYSSGPQPSNSDILKNLMKNYDSRLRPNLGYLIFLRSTDGPLRVGLDLVLVSFDAISEVNMDFTITMKLNQYWQDERLAFGDERDVLTLPADFSDHIWVPDTFFPNDKHSFLHDVTEPNKMIHLRGDGSITYGMRFTATMSCTMDLHYFPQDSQNCSVEVESYGYTVQDLVFFWKDPGVYGFDGADVSQFSVTKYRTLETNTATGTGTYQRMKLTFKLRRNLGYFLFQTYLPLGLIVMLSWVSFWINHEATPARVALGITTVLTMTTISAGVRSSLPRISYVKAIDIYLVMSFVFVFAALLEYAAVHFINASPQEHRHQKRLPRYEMTEGDSPINSLRRAYSTQVYGAADNDRIHPESQLHLRMRSASNIDLSRKRRRRPRCPAPVIKDVSNIDRASRILFPTLFLAFNVVYWSYYTVKSLTEE